MLVSGDSDLLELVGGAPILAPGDLLAALAASGQGDAARRLR